MLSFPSSSHVPSTVHVVIPRSMSPYFDHRDLHQNEATVRQCHNTHFMLLDAVKLACQCIADDIHARAGIH